MIEFKKKCSMTNGNKVTKKNWHKVVAISSRPDTGCSGWPEVDKAKKEQGAYYMKWKLVYETNDDPHRCGFIFREINTNSGINGHHPNIKQAIWSAIKPHIQVFLELEPSNPKPETLLP